MASSSTGEQIAVQYWEALLPMRSFRATEIGDERYDDRLEDPTTAGRSARTRLAAETVADLDRLGHERVAGLEGEIEDAVTADVLRFLCEVELETVATERWRLESIDHMDRGPAVALVMLAQAQWADTPERLDRWLARLAAYPRYIEGPIEQINEARGLGILPSKIVAQRVLDQLDGLLAEPAVSTVFVTAPPVADPADRERIAVAVAANVQPSLARFRDVIHGLLSEARTEPGLWAVPGGDRMYLSAVREWTTVQIDPEELHRSGRDDLEQIERERQLIARGAGHGADTAAYRRSLAADPINIPTSADALLGRMEADIARAQAAAPKWFGRLPRAGCEVQPLADAIAGGSPGYFLSATPDGARPGVFYMNTSDLPSRLFSRSATTIYHETVPGHHLQIGLQNEHPSLSPFRRLGADLCAGAFVEGWGLYAERLADEMGLFRTDGERFGMLDAQAWRAARLVIDTGLHAFGWDRERAVDELVGATGFERVDAEIEVDRYVAIPGQALAYKVGQREIERLRAGGSATAEAAGRSFDLRHFHDELLGHGALPLSVLGARLPGWLGES
ncbi:MAG TPA: DUF885 domain-containing protein [Candidatus Limnocylindrales bacterium]